MTQLLGHMTIMEVRVQQTHQQTTPPTYTVVTLTLNSLHRGNFNP